MGLQNSSDTRKTYINIVGGKFAVSSKEGAEGVVSRKNKNDKVVWELQYDTLKNVLIKNIEKKVGDFGASWEITLQEGIDDYILNLPYSGRVTNGLLFRLPNINLKEPVTLRIFIKDEKAHLYALDATGGKINAFYSKETPNGIPQLEKVKLKGVETWDDTKQMEFIENMIETTILPKFKKTQTKEKEDGSDLPFAWIVIPMILPLLQFMI